MAENFFTREVFGGMPMWVVIVGGSGVALIALNYSKNRKTTATPANTATTSGIAATDTNPNIFFLPQGADRVPGSGPSNGTPNVPTTTSGAPTFVHFSSNGSTSLDDYAKQFDTQPSQIWWATQTSERTPQILNNYENAGNYNAPIPAGLDLYYPSPG